MKIFFALPTRNDAWILSRVLTAASLVADHIIVLDENSWDETEAICKRFPKVIFLQFTPDGFNESRRRKMLLDAVRNFDGQNFVYALDSDEILSADILQPGMQERFFSSMKPGWSLELQWVMFWKNVRDMRFDQSPAWSDNYKQFAYWDDRKISFEDVRMHSSRVPEGTREHTIRFQEVKVLHYAYAEWERCLAKHRYYLALEKTMGNTSHPYNLNRRYRWFYNERQLVVRSVPGDWVLPYEAAGVDMAELPTENLYWYEEEMLRFFKRYSPAYFRHLNIWDVNWSDKQRLAKQRGSPGIYDGEFRSVQPWYDKLYYHYLQELVDIGSPIDQLLTRLK